MADQATSDKCCPKQPADLGMPEQFDAWRSNQKHFINLALQSKKRVTTICAPTGFGKQVCTTAIALASQQPTAIVVPNRGLQNQYMKMEIPGMVSLMGRSNYTCINRDDPDYSCEQGYAARCPFKGTVSCPASHAEMVASASRIVVTNYDKWTHTKKFGVGMSHFTQVIFDEGHHMVDALERALQVILHHKEIEETLEIPFLTGEAADDMREWKLWASAARAISEDKMVQARSKIAHSNDPKSSWVRHFLHMKNLTKRLGTLSTAPAKEWVVEATNEGFQFDPLRPGRYVESTLLLRVPKVIAVSATIRPKTMFLSGIGRDNFDFTEFDSDFDPKRGPIYWVPTQKVEWGMDLSLMWNRLDQVASRRRGVKGIVHTVSFTRQKELYERSRYVSDMIINPQGEPPTEKIEEFYNAGPGSIFVTPSVGEGYDFPDDACRWQFVCKIPFEPPSKIQKARQAEDKEYVYYRAMNKLVQMFGRDVRSKKDWSERFIPDNNVEWFIPRYGHLAPKSFHMVFRRVDVLPAPLQL